MQIVLVNLINNRTSSAPKAALLLLIVWGCVVLYLLNCGKSTATDIPNVMIATGIGYGVIFIVGYIVMNMGLELPGIVAGSRYDNHVPCWYSISSVLFQCLTADCFPRKQILRFSR